MSRPGQHPAQPASAAAGSSSSATTSGQVQQPTARQVTAAQSVAASRDLADEILSSLVEFENRAKILFDRVGNALNEPYRHEDAKSTILNIFSLHDFEFFVTRFLPERLLPLLAAVNLYHNFPNLFSKDIDELLQYFEQIESIVQKNDLQYLSYEPDKTSVKEGDAPPKTMRSFELANLCRTSINSMDRATKAILVNAQTARHALKSAIASQQQQQQQQQPPIVQVASSSSI